MACPRCPPAAEFQDYRPKTPLRLLGAVSCRRASYYCHRCGQGVLPWDQAVGLTPKRLTPAAEQVVSLAGAISNSFAEAAEQGLPERAALRLAETTVERTTEAPGQRIGRLLAEGRGFGFRQRWTWHADACGRTCAYISIDATGVRQQANNGGRAAGRMPYGALLYNPVPERPDDSPDRPSPQATMPARYLAGLYELDALGVQLRRQASQVRRDQAQQWIAWTDGGNGLENCAQKHFPRALVLLLDFGHAAEDGAELAKLLHPTAEERANDRKQQWCQIMKQQGGAAILAALEELPLPARKPAVQAKHTEIRGYFRNHVHRMDDPRYLANGWLIGSGAVESACKTVVGQRLQLSGMRWRQPGTDAMCPVRALFKSERSQWQAFWQRSINC